VGSREGGGGGGIALGRGVVAAAESPADGGGRGG
jgi:hypothetical protein